MKKLLTLTAVIAMNLTTIMQAQAATTSGPGCGINGVVSYALAVESSSGMSIYTVIGNQSCTITGIADMATTGVIMNVLTQSQTSGTQAYVITVGVGGSGSIMAALQGRP